MKKIYALMATMMLATMSFAAQFNIYVDNQTGWTETALYAWADGRTDILGGWPGIQPTGQDGKYLVFTVDETVVPANLIFNNNGGGAQVEGVYITEAADIRLVATATTLKVEGAPEIVNTNFIYVENQTGWEVLKMYAYSEGRTTILGPWPGKDADETRIVDNISYQVFGVPADFAPANIILNNNNGTQLADYYIAEQKDYYLVATANGVREQGTPELVFDTYHINVTNQTGWTDFYLYAWGDSEVFGVWPGAQGAEFEYSVPADSTQVELHLIFHNNVGEGVEGDQRQLFDITEARDYNLIVTAEGVTESATSLVETLSGTSGKAVKRFANGQLVIIREGKIYNALGSEL